MVEPAHTDRSLPPEIDMLAKKLAKDPQSKVFIQLAEEYVKAGLFHEASAVLEDGLKTYPTFLTARVALGRVYYQLGLVPKAKAMLEEAVKMSPENLLAHRTLAQLYVQEGASESALRSCSVVLSANPQDEEVLALKATIDKQVGSGTSSAAQKAREAIRTASVSPHPREGTAVGDARASTTVASSDASSPEAAPASAKFERLTTWLQKIRQRRNS
ncbi:MAG TPA: tetratricopeptide repeat protein [Nitrospiraceae bacterium]|nr:tetratricopeptide repeat protein [Nitrospiraceae bacterium]